MSNPELDWHITVLNGGDVLATDGVMSNTTNILARTTDARGFDLQYSAFVIRVDNSVSPI